MITIPDGRTIDTWFCKIDDDSTKDVFNRAIKLVFDVVVSAGGDGDGHILCKHFYFKHVADYLEENFLKDTHFTRASEGEEYVAFTDDQANIVIMHHNDENMKQTIYDDITIII
jgi:hypothetical protein